MTCAYNTYFVLVSGSVVLAVPGAITLLVLSHPERYVLGYVTCMILVLWTIVLRFHGSQVRIRAGAWPALCRGDITPTTENDLRSAILEIVKRTGNPPAIVGSAWGFFIKRYGPKGPRIFMHEYKGRDPFTKRWRAGTTIAAVARELKADGKTFPSHPTMDYISIAAFYGFANHGNGADDNIGSSKCLKNARVLDMRSGIVTIMEYPELRRTFDREHERFCILDLEFQNLVDNDNLQKKGIIIDSVQSAQEWIDDGAVLRVCFQGAARSYAIGVRWTRAPSGLKTDHPHFGSRFGMYAQADTCSVCCGWHEPIAWWKGVSSHYNANRWMPLVFPIETVFTVLTGYRNFELFFRLPYALSGVTLYCLIESMIELHSQIGGRSEVRYGKQSPDTPVFLDCVFRHSFHRVFEMLNTKFEVLEVALHPGKHSDLDTTPIDRVTVARVYGMEATLI